MKETKILLVGLGGMGRVHFKNIERIEKAEIVASVGAGERDRSTAEEFGLPFYSSITEAVAAHPEVQVIDITTPTFLHRTHVEEALGTGRDTICEKPLALSSKDARELFALARKKGVSLNVGQVLRYTKEYLALLDAVKSERYGRVLDASFTRLSVAPKWAKDGWLYDKKKSGLIPFDLHIHDLDMIYSLFGEPDTAKLSRRQSEASATPEYYHMDYGYHGFSVRGEAGWLNACIPFTATWRVIFENAVMTNDGSVVTVYPADGEPQVIDTSYDVVISTGINVPPTGWYYEELRTILDRVSEKHESIFDESEILGVLELLEKM